MSTPIEKYPKFHADSRHYVNRVETARYIYDEACRRALAELHKALPKPQSPHSEQIFEEVFPVIEAYIAEAQKLRDAYHKECLDALSPLQGYFNNTVPIDHYGASLGELVRKLGVVYIDPPTQKESNDAELGSSDGVTGSKSA